MITDEASIRAWVSEACRVAHLPGHAGELGDRVLERLAKGEREYGPGNFRKLGIERVLSEAAEEGVDIPGWLVLAVRLMYEAFERGELEGERMQGAHSHVIRAAAYGALARAEIAAAAEVVGTRRLAYREAAPRPPTG